tara:strand:- start:546 stop:731 length:186 start_codon:yes stop_codon:yes gene_type:complete
MSEKDQEILLKLVEKIEKIENILEELFPMQEDSQTTITIPSDTMKKIEDFIGDSVKLLGVS